MALVTVVFSVVVNADTHGINIDRHRLDNDDAYKFVVTDNIKNVAEKILQNNSVDGIIHQCDEIPELVE